MSDGIIKRTSAAELRRKAEVKVASQPAPTGELDAKRLLHELQVYKCELEMQNDELHRVIAEKTVHETHLHNILTQTPAGYFCIDTEGYFLNVNDAWLRMHGYDAKDEVIGKHFGMVQVDRSSCSALVHLAELKRGVPIPTGEFESRRKDGSVGHHIFSAHPVMRIGEIVGFEWFIIDISKRKEAEVKLHISEEKFSTAFHISPDSININRLADGMYVEINEGFTAITGYTAEEVIGKTSLELNIWDNPEDRSRLVRELKKCGIANNLEATFRRKDGTTVDGLMSARVINIEGEPCILSISRDISLRKQTERLLKASEERFKIYVELSPNAVFVVDENGQYIDVNPAASTITGFSKDELLTMKILDLLPQESQEWGKDSFKQLFATGYYQGEAAFKRKNGEIGYWSLTAVKLSSCMFMGIVTDVTEHKRDEQIKAKLEIRLNQSQKMEAIGQLAGGVAHDFNNKLMTIMGFTELSKMDIHDSDKLLHYLDEIRRAAEHSKDITFRLLAFSRQQVISPLALEANKVIADALKSLSRLIGEHISISLRPYDKLWSIRMDPVQLDQVVMNMAINARDAMPGGGSLVIESRNTTMDTKSCRAIADAVPGDYVLITFSDTGTGMDKETLSHLFEPFFTTKEVGKGTGLGLATIHGIIRQNKGFIDVTSNVGYGTEFKVYIPRFSEQVKENTTKADTISTGSCTILLVEDEDAVRKVISLFLNKLGYTVHEAATPTVALKLADDSSIQIDLVLTDYVMPKMNGRAMMEQIHKLRPQLPCIYASGFSTEHVQLSEEAHFLQKPYDLIKLSSLLKRVFSEREGQ
jgi:PAS domain S-box-containing protein